MEEGRSEICGPFFDIRNTRAVSRERKGYGNAKDSSQTSERGYLRTAFCSTGDFSLLSAGAFPVRTVLPDDDCPAFPLPRLRDDQSPVSGASGMFWKSLETAAADLWLDDSGCLVCGQPVYPGQAFSFYAGGTCSFAIGNSWSVWVAHFLWISAGTSERLRIL